MYYEDLVFEKEDRESVQRSVQRSLFQTVILVEENEALEYLGQTLEGSEYSGQTC